MNRASLHHTFDINLAAKYGIEEAIIIHHFQHWVMVNHRKGINRHEGRTWTYQTRKDIAAHFPYIHEQKVKRIIAKLKRLKIIRVGNYNKSAMDKTNWYAFENEEMFTMDQNDQSMDQNDQSMDQNDQPIPDTKTDPNLHIHEGIAPKPPKGTKKGSDRAMPFDSDQKEGSGKPSKSRKHPRTKEKQQCFEWLMSLGLTDEHGKVDEDSMSFLAYAHTMQRLKDVYSHFVAKTSKKGFVFKKSPIALFRDMLKKEHAPINENCKINREYAERCKQEVGWTSLCIKEKYVIDENLASKDISLNLDPEEFKKQLLRLNKQVRGQ